METSKPPAKVSASKRELAKVFHAIHIAPTANKGFVVTHHYKDGTKEAHAITDNEKLHEHIGGTLAKWHPKKKKS